MTPAPTPTRPSNQRRRDPARTVPRRLHDHEATTPLQSTAVTEGGGGGSDIEPIPGSAPSRLRPHPSTPHFGDLPGGSDFGDKEGAMTTPARTPRYFKSECIYRRTTVQCVVIHRETLRNPEVGVDPVPGGVLPRVSVRVPLLYPTPRVFHMRIHDAVWRGGGKGGGTLQECCHPSVNQGPLVRTGIHPPCLDEHPNLARLTFPVPYSWSSLIRSGQRLRGVCVRGQVSHEPTPTRRTPGPSQQVRITARICRTT